MHEDPSELGFVQNPPTLHDRNEVRGLYAHILHSLDEALPIICHIIVGAILFIILALPAVGIQAMLESADWIPEKGDSVEPGPAEITAKALKDPITYWVLKVTKCALLLADALFIIIFLYKSLVKYARES